MALDANLIDRLLWKDLQGRKTIIKFLEQAWFPVVEPVLQPVQRKGPGRGQQGKRPRQDENKPPVAVDMVEGAPPAKRRKQKEQDVPPLTTNLRTRGL